MAVPAVPAFPGRLDARSPRRGECATREAPAQPRGLCSVLGRRPQRQLPHRLLRMSCRAVGFAPRCADVEPYERARMRGHGLLKDLLPEEQLGTFISKYAPEIAAH